MTTNRYSSIDGLRSFAAIGIVIMHVLANIDLPPDKEIWLYGSVISSFGHFVNLFFMISAFSMCCGYYERMKTGQISMNRFYMKRYQRILPFFAIMVFIDCIVSFVFKYDNNLLPDLLYEVFANLTLCFNLLPNPNIKVIGVGWYLGTIFLFYMIFPFFIFMIDNKKRMWIVTLLTFMFSYIAINYFFTEKFINWTAIKYNSIVYSRNIIYSFPFFVVGGGIYLYRQELSTFVSKYRWLMAGICWTMTMFYLIAKPSGFLFVVSMCLLCGLWLIYAIGTAGKVLNNHITKYLSGISMELYLCHMMFFRGVDMLHLSRYISQPDLLYWLTCILTLGGAIIFSHIVKYKFLPLIEPYLFRQSK